PNSFADDIAAFAEGGCANVEVWLTKLEVHLETNTVHGTHAILKERSITLLAAAYQGGLLLSQGDARRAAFDHFKPRLDPCPQFGIPTMVLVADFATRPTETDLASSIVSMTQAATWPAGLGVPLAVVV